MLRELLSDRRGRSAFVFTVLGVLVAASVATWPLSRLVGVRAWYALAIFALVQAGITVVVLLGSRRSAVVPSDEAEDGDDESPQIEETVALPVEDSIDLHSFPPRDVPAVVADYLDAAHAEGFREVRLIHGRGIGVQRERVQSLLGRHPLVESFRDAPPERGGWGATVAFLVESDPDD